jgi:uncharacterized protein RhaS with RHS repeats
MTLLAASAHRRPNFRNRDYSPALGRFLGQSPLGFDEGDNNIYRYTSNNPANNRDPSGQLGSGLQSSPWQDAISGSRMGALLAASAEAKGGIDWSKAKPTGKTHNEPGFGIVDEYTVEVDGETIRVW